MPPNEWRISVIVGSHFLLYPDLINLILHQGKIRSIRSDVFGNSVPTKVVLFGKIRWKMRFFIILLDVLTPHG